MKKCSICKTRKTPKWRGGLCNRCYFQQNRSTSSETVVESVEIENLGHNNALQDQSASLRASHDEAIRQKEMLANELKCLREELKQIRDDHDHQLEALTDEVWEARAEVFKTRTVCEDQKRIIGELQERLAEKELQVIEGENLRKKLYNTILELKGNIRVFCRVRPLLPDDGPTREMAVSYPASTEALGRGIKLVHNGQKYLFTFDKVFNHEASQKDVFTEISQLIQSAVDGFKVCIFAYGQTGSGKTHTMMGRPGDPELKGLIPRSLEQVFHISQSLKDQGWKYKMQASILEIYNESIRDLLSPNRSGDVGLTRSGTNAKGKTHLSDLTTVDVCSVNEISSLLQQAAQSRSVGITQMNEQSSRSHTVFTLRLYGINENTEQQVQGVLNLIDLAGSEPRSGATGDRLKETQAIDKSLSSLSDVFLALAKKEDYVPFRNSKLTFLLQPYLGGDSKALMFVNISPDRSSTGESLCSLRFASRINSCEIGIPQRQTSTRSFDSRLKHG